MIARLLVAGWALVAALVAALAPAAAEERIERFVSEVEVQRNGDLLVTESIAIRAEGRQIKRGILRDFPTTYRRRDGSRVQVGFEVQAVTRDGAAETFATERMANGVRVRIGSGDRLVSRGLHQYVIRYRTTRQIGFFDRFDELYWNATGTAWTFPIDVAEARINLPEQANFIQSAFYTGPQGARGRDAEVVEQRPGRIVFRTTRPLPVANGLTVAAAFPKGVVVAPTQQQRIEAVLHDDPALVYAALGAARWCSASICWPGSWSAAIRRAAPSFRCSARPRACRPPPCATSGKWASTTGCSPRPSSASALPAGSN